MTSIAHTHVAVGETVQGFGGRGPYTVTEDDCTRLSCLRGACTVAAWHRATLLYGDVAPLLGVASQAMGRVLDLLSEDCRRRGEPALAALIVRADTGRVGAGFVGDAAAERERSYRYWREHRGQRA